MPENTFTRIQQGDLIQVISDTIKNDSEQRFCFILGAGASKQSGILTAGELATEWISELLNSNKQETEKWLTSNLINPKNIAEFYSDVYEYRFKINPQAGFDRLIKQMDGKFPSYGYSILAQILTKTRNNIVLTTNFDSLTEQAIYYYTSSWPLIIGHENLAEFARPSNKRPLITKLHRDLLLSPFNKKNETQILNNSWEIILTEVFNQCIPIFIGYGGNDGSLMTYLKKLKKCQNFFWCTLKNSDSKREILDLLNTQCGKLVEIDGFDEFFFLLGQNLNYQVLHKELVQISLTRLREYEQSIEHLTEKLTQEKKPEYDFAIKNIISTLQKQIPNISLEEQHDYVEKAVLSLSKIKKHCRLKQFNVILK